MDSNLLLICILLIILFFTFYRETFKTKDYELTSDELSEKITINGMSLQDFIESLTNEENEEKKEIINICSI